MSNNNQIIDKYDVAKILGEIFKLQKRVDPDMCPVTDDTIYGLSNGIEEVIDEAMGYQPITDEKKVVTRYDLINVCDILDEYEYGDIDSFHGYHIIEKEIEAKGIDRSKALIILTYLQIAGRYARVIDKINSSNSLIEMNKLESNRCDI